jgi:hypothetical protein
MNIRVTTSRRNFLKAAGVATSIPLLPDFAFGSNLNSKEKLHRILTCNIRVALADDEKDGVGWSVRKKLCAAVIKKQKPDIICMQEVLREQNEDLKNALPGYFSFGFEGPEMDKYKDGYHGIAKNPIFFSEKRYQLVAAGQY